MIQFLLKNGVIFLKNPKNLVEFMVNLIISQQLSTITNSIWKMSKIWKNKMLSLIEIFSKKNSDTLKNCGLSKNKVKAAILLRQNLKKKD